MAENNGAAKFFDAMNESYDALIDGIRATNERGHRISAALIEDTQRGQREVVELAKKWADAPLDLIGFYSSVLEATTKAQTRALEVTRQWVGEMTEAQKETRDVLQRIVSANRNAGEAAVDLSRGIFSRTSEAMQSTSQAPAAAATGDGRRTAREPARAAEAARASESDATSEA